jgi:hypothetical protein
VKRACAKAADASRKTSWWNLTGKLYLIQLA